MLNLSKIKQNKILFISTILVIILVIFVLAVMWRRTVFTSVKIDATGKITSTTPPDQINQNIKDFGLIIDKLGLSAPIKINVDGDNKQEYNEALNYGLAQFKGSGLPGDGKNIFIFGHSGRETLKNPYNKILNKLNDLQKDDLIVVYYKNKKFEYTVAEKKIIEKDDLSVLELGEREQLTLMTCWPIGTKDKRLVIIAK